MKMRTLSLPEAHGEESSCVRQVPIFAGLSPEQQDLVASVARPLVLSPGELVHVAGEQSGQMSVVHTGEVKLSRTMPSGRQRLLRVARSGDTLGEHAFLSRGATLEEAEASTQAQLCVFVHDDFSRLVNDYPDIAIRMLQDVGDRLAQTERDLALSTLSVDVRLADFLLQQPLLPEATRTGGANRRQVQLPLSKKDIASLLGTTPESLSRALGRLTSNELISVDADLVTLLDPQGLDDVVTNA